MSLIKFIKDIKYMCTIFLLLLSVNIIVRAKIVTYTDYCNKTITIGEINDIYAGIINFKYSRPVGNNETFICVVQIVTTPGSHISATFTDASTISKEWGTMRTCDTSILLTGNFYRSQYCRSLPRDEVISTHSYLRMKFQSTGGASVSFKMIFNTFNYCDKQGQRDVMCNNGRCIDQSLVCASEDNLCRDDTELCISAGGDSVKSGLSVSTTSGIVCTVLAIIVTFGIVVTIFHKRKISQQSNRPVVRTAADVFIVRTSDDPDGGDASPINTRTFDLPPEYSSLENLAGSDNSREHVHNTIADKTDDLPPEYQSVIANATDYKVTLHI